MNRLRTVRKKNLLLLLGALTIAVALAGCENEDTDSSGDSSRHRKESSENAKNDSDKAQQDGADGTDADLKKEKPSFTYLEPIMIEDIFGDMAEYEVYAPKGSSYGDGQVYYNEHGLTFFAYASSYEEGISMPELLEYSMHLETDSWEEPSSGHTDVTLEDIAETGENLYQIASAKRTGTFDIPFEIKNMVYMDLEKDGVCVQWNLFVSEIGLDSEGALIIDELAQCYGFDAEKVKPDSGYAAAYEAHIQAEKAKDSLPATVLWFNATYAPSTQSNKSFGTDWKLVGGMNATEYNAEFIQQILNRDWNITDAASALETVENLKKDGHRKTFRNCENMLADLGILDADKTTFVDTLSKLIEADQLERNVSRYISVYSLHQKGLDADCIAAWDLCRVNMLYADFYICGYMTYEEAMDASLENSLILQGMYSSWEEMMASYLLGYQFWKGDSLTEDDSPTQQRYQCYLELLEMEDGPYSLDWNMELSKSW